MPLQTQWGGGGIDPTHLQSSTRRKWVVSTMLRLLYPKKKTWYPLYRRVDGPQGRSGQVQTISRPPGLDPQTIQPVASHYADWAVLDHAVISSQYYIIQTTMGVP